MEYTEADWSPLLFSFQNNKTWLLLPFYGIIGADLQVSLSLDNTPRPILSQYRSYRWSCNNAFNYFFIRLPCQRKLNIALNQL